MKKKRKKKENLKKKSSTLQDKKNNHVATETRQNPMKPQIHAKFTSNSRHNQIRRTEPNPPPHRCGGDATTGGEFP